MELAPRFTSAAQVDSTLVTQGQAAVESAEVHALLGVPVGALSDWPAFWNALPPDAHLRDGGRYRRRRHGSFVVEQGRVTQVSHRAHWQPLDYNALHGGIERWFEPLEAGLVAHPMWPPWLLMLAARADALRGAQPWFVEAHAFRIDTGADGIGRPTPEGAHRDGVDLVVVTLIARDGIKGGETRVFDADGPSGQRFTMSQPWTTLLLDDARVIHETTPIQPIDPASPGHRDTLVITLRANGFQNPAPRP
jgi:hypothetical protein